MLCFEDYLIIYLDQVPGRPSHTLGAVQKQKQIPPPASANPVQNKRYQMDADRQQGMRK